VDAGVGAAPCLPNESGAAPRDGEAEAETPPPPLLPTNGTEVDAVMPRMPRAPDGFCCSGLKPARPGDDADAALALSHGMESISSLSFLVFRAVPCFSCVVSFLF
jgi:hypothetical protein